MKASHRFCLLVHAALIVALCATMSPSHATLVTWRLDGVKIAPGSFDGVTSATGWFVYDASTKIVVDWNIKSPDHRWPCCYLFDVDLLAPARYPGYQGFGLAADVVPDAAPGGGAMAFFFEDRSNQRNLTLNVILRLTTAKPLTDAGGRVDLLPTYSNFTFSPLDGSSLLAGSLIGTPVPEPSEFLFVAVGIIALVGVFLLDAHVHGPLNGSRFFGSTMPTELVRERGCERGNPPLAGLHG